MKSSSINRKCLIASMTFILLIVFFLWLFIYASEVKASKQEYYKSYRGNIFGIAGDFCVFTKEDASLSECTADIAIGGNLKKGSFGNYETQWEGFYKQNLDCVNLNSYIRGKYESDGKYCWQAKRTKAELTYSTDKSYKGTYDCGNENGKANLYIYTKDNKNVIDNNHNTNECKINGKSYENTQCHDNNGTYNAYNLIGVEYEFINFDAEFENLKQLSESLKKKGEAIKVSCKNENNGSRTFEYTIPAEQNMTIITVDPDNFFDSSICDNFSIKGLDTNKKIIINVDCTGRSYPVTPKISIQGNSNDWNPLAKNIIWNFYYPENSEEIKLEAKEIIGTILAPNINIYINGNLDGSVIAKKVEANTIHGINSGISSADLSKNKKEETTQVYVEKIWNDNNEKDKRPEKVEFELFADEVKKGVIELKEQGKFVEIKKTKKDEENDKTNENNIVYSTPDEEKLKEWSCTVINLPKYRDNDGKQDEEEIVYTIKEVNVNENYVSKIEVMKDDNKDDEYAVKYKIINTHVPEKIEIKGTKTWEDNNNEDGIRPEKITVRLLANGEETAHKDVTEDDDWAYEFKNLPKYKNGEEIDYTIKEDTVTDYVTTIDGYNITNTHTHTNTHTNTPEKIEIKETKTWEDNNNQDGMRPEEITVKLLADGIEVDSKTVTEKDDWKYKFTDLDQYKDGEKIEYTIDEETIPKYEKSIKGYDITNEHKPDKISVEGNKTWDDLNNQDGMRPESIIVKLLADGKVVQTKKVTEADNWTYKFEDLDKYKKGIEIIYTVDEEKVEGYEKEIHGYNIINRHGMVAGEEVRDIDVTKKWEDKGYEELRPNKVTVSLLANGEVIGTKDITANDKWKTTFKKLEMYDEEGNEIEYSVKEEAITGYETRIEGFEIINTYIPPVADNKIVIKINKYEKGTTKKLSDAKFELLIKKEDGKDKDNKKKYKEVLKETNTTNSIGQIVLKDLDLEEGTYVLELNEKEAPKGYKKSDDSIKIEFTIKEKNGKKVVELKNKNKNVQIDKTTMTIKIENAKEQKKDNTTSKGKLPQTGPGNMVIAGIVIVGFLAVGAIGIFKYREVKY